MTLPWGLPISRSRAWLLVPVALGLMLLVAIVLSNLQEELGLADPGPSGRAAVAAAALVDRALSDATARDLGSSEPVFDDPAAYDEFSDALRVAVVAHRNMVVGNPVDIELDHLLRRTLGYYEIARSAWQAALERAWDPAIHGDPTYWRAVYPGFELPDTAPLAPADIVEAARVQAAALLAKAIDMVED